MSILRAGGMNRQELISHFSFFFYFLQPRNRVMYHFDSRNWPQAEAKTC